MTRTIKKWTARDAAKCVITPSDLDHKYSRGVLGVITGSAQYPGAAVLTRVDLWKKIGGFSEKYFFLVDFFYSYRES